MAPWPWNSFAGQKTDDDAIRRRKLGKKLFRFLNNYNSANKQKILGLIKAGAHVNHTDSGGMTTLMHAARGNDPDIFRAIFNAGADVSAKSNHGDTALMWLMYKGDNVQLAEMIVAADPKLLHHANNDNLNALYIAAGHGRTALAQYLLGKDIDYAQKDGTGRTPRENALKNNHPFIAELIDQHAGKKVAPKFGEFTVVDDMNVKTGIGDGLTVTFNFLTQQALYRDSGRPEAIVAVTAFNAFPNKDMISKAHTALAEKNPHAAPPAPFAANGVIRTARIVS